MTQRELEHELARATGETIAAIRSHGFSLVETPEPQPRMIDWDALDAERVAVFPCSYGRGKAA